MLTISAAVIAEILLFRLPMRYERLIFFGYFAVAVVVIAVFGLLKSVGDIGYFAAQHHFGAYTYSIIQVAFGKNLAVDFVNQYGLYPYLLLPVWQLSGIGLAQIAAFLLVLKIIVLTLLAILLYKNCNNKLIATFGFGASVWFLLMHAAVMNDVPRKDLYFQYNPHRLIFPLLFLVLLSSYLRVEKFSNFSRRARYLLLCVVAVAALLWNFDSGIVVFIAWLVIIPYSNILNSGSWTVGFRAAIRHWLVMFAVAISGFSLLCGCIYLRCGNLPDLSALLLYGQLFAGYGFFMLPLKLSVFQPWLLIVGVFAAAVIVTVITLNTRMKGGDIGDGASTTLVAALAVVGFGLFSYYLGRAQMFNLDAVIWPALILLTFFVDTLFTKIRTAIDTTRGHSRF